MALSDDLSALAINLISQFGESASFNRYSEANYNAQTGIPGMETIVSYSGYVYPQSYKLYEINNTTILAGDLQVLCYQMTQVPTVGDILTFGSNSYRIVTVEKTRLNGVDVLYTCQVRE